MQTKCNQNNDDANESKEFNGKEREKKCTLTNEQINKQYKPVKGIWGKTMRALYKSVKEKNKL